MLGECSVEFLQFSSWFALVITCLEVCAEQKTWAGCACRHLRRHFFTVVGWVLCLDGGVLDAAAATVVAEYGDALG
ncbi:hypothetical protein AB672_09850 [Xylella taiwanensis]|nr:hypothetical protein AB672_09850 [Xylella taiwanensis]